MLMDEKKSFEKAMKSDPVFENHVIMSIPGIGPITGSVILGKICDISRFESAEKLAVMCSLYYLDSYKRDNILLKVYKGESRGGFANLLHTLHGIGDAHA